MRARPSTHCKELGHWGENQLDQWLGSAGWHPAVKNLKIRGGEIDRVYLKQDGIKLQYCVTEIKTNILYSTKSFTEIFTEVGIKRYLKQRQLRNIYRCGEQILIQKNTIVFLRLFIILKLRKNLFINTDIIPRKGPIKICHSTNDLYILSIEPEFTTIQSRKSMLQVKV